VSECASLSERAATLFQFSGGGGGYTGCTGGGGSVVVANQPNASKVLPHQRERARAAISLN